VVLACGAWRDRPLPIEGADAYVGKGLVYQNPFVIAFNHAERGDLPGATYDVLPGAIIVGGGLASIDVAKIHTLELTIRELAKRGIETNVVELEVKGIPKILSNHGLSFENLGIVPPTIYYRRRVEDMPLMSAPEDADAARIAKVEAGRRRMLEKSTEKYCFKVEPLSAPEALIVENGRLVGLRFRRTKMEDGKLKLGDETFEARGPVVISSIGSIPEPIEGIAMKGELFDFKDWEIGRLEGYPTVFSVGNVVTGKGNIVASRKHATQVSEEAVEAYLGVGGDDRSAAMEVRPGIPEADRAAEHVLASLGNAKPLSTEQIQKLRERVAKLQRAVGYDDYKSWMDKVGQPC
jgi:NADPH-dependent glutamate synthase beta subunit-like oxidoreductase